MTQGSTPKPNAPDLPPRQTVQVVDAARSLTVAEKRVFAKIMSYAQGKDGPKPYGCYLSAGKMAALLGYKEETVKRARARLRKRGLLIRRPPPPDSPRTVYSWYPWLPKWCHQLDPYPPAEKVLWLANCLDRWMRHGEEPQTTTTGTKGYARTPGGCTPIPLNTCTPIPPDSVIDSVLDRERLTPLRTQHATRPIPPTTTTSPGYDWRTPLQGTLYPGNGRDPLRGTNLPVPGKRGETR